MVEIDAELRAMLAERERLMASDPVIPMAQRIAEVRAMLVEVIGEEGYEAAKSAIASGLYPPKADTA